MAGPLEGILVLDWTQFQLGTSATTMLADLGASVIHIEEPVSGDGGRGFIRRDTPPLPQDRSAYFETNNRGKKSMTVDLSRKRGRELIHRLVKKADVFVHNFRQGVPEKLELDYETLRQHNPRLVYAAASGYGPSGAEAREPSFDYIGLARSGIMNQTGEPDMRPLPVYGGIGDQMGAIMTGYAVLAALLARERLGTGQKVDVSHLGSLMALQRLAIGMMLYHGEEVIVRANRKRERNPLWNVYQCSDGKWLVLGMLQPDRRWPIVCRALGIEHLEKDPRYEDAVKRAENCEELIAVMDGVFSTRSVSEWMRTLKEAGDIICCPVQTLSDLIDDPQVLANDYIVDADHEVFGPVKVPGIPIRFSETPGEIRCEAPELGQHTEEILIGIGGYGWEDIAQLREEGAI
jgi:crotonobetainyl-CoA:carnitine CoA-transferase CaiB-like acyl-CoA transferase